MAAPPPATVRPLGWWYLVPVALAAAACVLCVVAVVRGFGDAREAALDANAAAPGSDQTLTIVDPGGYTIAYSGPIIVRSTSQQEQLAEDLQLAIEPVDGGAPLELRPYDGLNDLEQEGQQYVPLLTVRFEVRGDYVLRSTRTSDIDLDRSALVVHESPYGKLRSGAERAVVILVVGLALALLITVILARTRGRAKAAIRAAMPPPAPWPAPVPWGAPPPGGWRTLPSGGPGGPGAPGAPPAWPPSGGGPGVPGGPQAWPPSGGPGGPQGWPPPSGGPGPWGPPAGGPGPWGPSSSDPGGPGGPPSGGAGPADPSGWTGPGPPPAGPPPG